MHTRRMVTDGMHRIRHFGILATDAAPGRWRARAKPSALSAVPMSMWMTMRPKANASATK